MDIRKRGPKRSTDWSINVLCLNVLFVENPIHVQPAEPMRPTFFVPPHMTTGRFIHVLLDKGRGNP